MQLPDLYADFTVVLRTTEPGRAIVDNVLLPNNSRDTEVADVLGAPCDTSLSAKLAAGEYPEPELFFHDMKLAFGRLIAQFPQNAPEYEELSDLFKFASDLLVREAHRFGFTKLAGSDDDDYLYKVSQGFHKISTELQDYNAETFWATAANGPLFMSTTNKAPFDPRDTAVAGSVHTVKLMPHVARAPEATLGVTAPLNPVLPQPYATPSDLLAAFVHPNVHTTMPPLWLASADPYSTFAPTVDSSGSVIGGSDATQVWLEKSGLTGEPKYEAGQDGGQEDGQDSGQKAQLPAAPAGPEEAKPEIDIDDKSPLQSSELESILRWSPYNFVDSDEIEARKNNAEVELVSRLLLKLAELQQDRFAVSESLQDISDEERHTALKISNLLTRLIEVADANDIKLDLDTRLPVLMRNYSGALPATADVSPLPQRDAFDGSPRLHTLAGLRSRSVRR